MGGTIAAAAAIWLGAAGAASAAEARGAGIACRSGDASAPPEILDAARRELQTAWDELMRGYRELLGWDGLT